MSVQRALRRRIPSRRRRCSIGERRGSEYVQGLNGPGFQGHSDRRGLRDTSAVIGFLAIFWT